MINKRINERDGRKSTMINKNDGSDGKNPHKERREEPPRKNPKS